MRLPDVEEKEEDRLLRKTELPSGEREIGKLKKVWERKREQRLYRREESPKKEGIQIDNRRPTDNRWGHSSRILVNNEEFRKNEQINEDRVKKGYQHRSDDTGIKKKR